MGTWEAEAEALGYMELARAVQVVEVLAAPGIQHKHNLKVE